jgi:hypothetical protein
MDGWRWPWTPKLADEASRLVKRSVVDFRGLGNSPEKRKVDSSILSLTT